MVRRGFPFLFRAVAVVFGLLLGLLAGAFGIIAYTGLEAVLKRDWRGLFEVGLGLAGGLTCGLWGWRLVAGRERKGGGLFSPLALRAVASCLLAAPLFAATFTGWTLRNPMGWLRLLQAVAYFAAAASLFRMASSHEREEREASGASALRPE